MWQMRLEIKRRLSSLRGFLINLPEHHHTFDRVALVVASFGKLCSIDTDKADVELSSCDALIDSHDVFSIPHKIDYFYDDFFNKEVSIEISFKMLTERFIELGLDTSNHSNCSEY